MKARIGRGDRRAWLALAAHLFVLTAIGLIGGGWLALARLDPLLAVPGLGWASAAMMVFLQQAGTWRAGLVSAGSAALLSAGLAAWLFISSGEMMPLVQILVLVGTSTVIGILLAKLWRLPRIVLTDQRRMGTGATALLAIVVGVGATNAAPLLLDQLYSGGRAADRPAVYLLTSLPLDGAAASVDDMLRRTGPAPARTWLGRHARVTVISQVSEATMSGAAVLLLAHPPALDPQDLVRLDHWLRAGGAALIFADGLSSWPLPHATGDARNPPVTSMLGPLLMHWGLLLEAPAGLEENRVEVWVNRQRLALFSPGRLHQSPALPSGAQANGRPHCRLLAEAHIADCAVGRGRAVIVADADWMMAGLWSDAAGGVQAAILPRTWRAGNMIWLTERIGELSGQAAAPSAWSIQPVWVRAADRASAF